MTRSVLLPCLRSVPASSATVADSLPLHSVSARARLSEKSLLGQQDFGGPFQFALTLGIGVPVYKKPGVAYRFLHYSDAGLNGSDTTGADFHMNEISYRF